MVRTRQNSSRDPSELLGYHRELETVLRICNAGLTNARATTLFDFVCDSIRFDLDEHGQTCYAQRGLCGAELRETTNPSSPTFHRVFQVKICGRVQQFKIRKEDRIRTCKKK